MTCSLACWSRKCAPRHQETESAHCSRIERTTRTAPAAGLLDMRVGSLVYRARSSGRTVAGVSALARNALDCSIRPRKHAIGLERREIWCAKTSTLNLIQIGVHGRANPGGHEDTVPVSVNARNSTRFCLLYAVQDANLGCTSRRYQLAGRETTGHGTKGTYVPTRNPRGYEYSGASLKSKFSFCLFGAKEGLMGPIYLSGRTCRPGLVYARPYVLCSPCFNGHVRYCHAQIPHLGYIHPEP